MTVEKWLGKDNQLGVDIWKKKYQNENETFDEWLDRITGGNNFVKDLILSKKFLYGGRILSNRGLQKNGIKSSMSNCFIPGSKVLTSEGFKNIEDVKVGDMVLSDDGEFHNVNAVMQRDYEGDLYEIDSPNLISPIRCTPNHKFLTNHGWKRADRILACSPQIHSSDKIKMAIPNKHNFQKEEVLDLLDKFVVLENKKIEYEDEKVRVVTVNENYKNLTYAKVPNFVNRYIKLDEEFSYFIGRWLGDGSVTSRKGKKNPSILQIVFNATTENDAFEKCKNIGEKVFGIKASYVYTKQNVIAMRFESEIIATWFKNHFGEKCDGKYVPDKYLGNFYMMIGLCDSDGMIDAHGSFKIVLKNFGLISWLRNTMYINGINASSIKDVKKQENTYQFRVTNAVSNNLLNPYLSKTYYDKRNNTIANKKDFTFSEISSINIVENYTGKVYNLSVDETHTYNVNGAIVHNCYVVSAPSDDIESIFECAKKLARTYSYGG